MEFPDREQLAKLINSLLHFDMDKEVVRKINAAKGYKSHIGAIELRYLMDQIYGGPPKKEEEFIISERQYKSKGKRI